MIDSAHVLQTRREQLTDDEWYEAVVAIHINAQTLARQIDKLLEEAHAEIQARSLHPERLELNELLRTTANGFAVPPDVHEVRFDGTGEVWARPTAPRSTTYSGPPPVDRSRWLRGQVGLGVTV